MLPAPPKQHGSDPTMLKNENSGIRGKQSYFDCIVPPTVGETDSTVAAAQAWAPLATQKITKMYLRCAIQISKTARISIRQLYTYIGMDTRSHIHTAGVRQMHVLMHMNILGLDGAEEKPV